MTRPFSCHLKQKMVERVSGTKCDERGRACQADRHHSAKSVALAAGGKKSPVFSPSRAILAWTVEQKAQIIARSSELNGDLLAAYLEGEGVIHS
jgi:hypothetical protein